MYSEWAGSHFLVQEGLFATDIDGVGAVDDLHHFASVFRHALKK